MQFYECEAYYWVAVANFAEALATVDPVEGARLKAEAEAYRKDLLTAVQRTITLSPVVPVRDGTFHSVIPFACYVRGLSTGDMGVETGRFWKSRRPDVLGNGPVGGGADQSGGALRLPAMCGSKVISTCWKIACFWRIRMSTVAIGSPPVGSIRVD